MVTASASVNLLMGGMGALSFNVLLPGLTLLAEGMLMLALVLFLLITQPLFSASMLATLDARDGSVGAGEPTARVAAGPDDRQPGWRTNGSACYGRLRPSARDVHLLGGIAGRVAHVERN